MAADGKSIEEAAANLEEISDKSVVHLTFATSEMIRASQRWRPNLFTIGRVEDARHFALGVPPGVRHGEPMGPKERVAFINNILSESGSVEEAQETEIQRIKRALQPGHAIASVTIQYAGRVDYGNLLAAKMRAALPVLGEIHVFQACHLWIINQTWGTLTVAYKIVDAETGACPA